MELTSSEEDGPLLRVELVVVRLRELASDEALLQLMPTTSPRRSSAELLVMLLSPTLQTLLSSASESGSAKSSLHLPTVTLLTVIRCLCEQVRQSTHSDATAQLLPPSLVGPLASLLSATLLSPITPPTAASTTSPSVSAVVSLLCCAPFLVSPVLSRLLLDVAVESAGRLCDVLLLLLHSRLRKWLLSDTVASIMREAVEWLHQAGGVDRAKLQAIEILL